MAKRSRDGGAVRSFTFEWVCQDRRCDGAGHIHRKKVKAEDRKEARLIAALIKIPPHARILEEDPDQILMRILS